MLVAILASNASESMHANSPALNYGLLASPECTYHYMHQPSKELDCDPFGRELQLHCGFIGPLSPEFNLVWYSSNGLGGSETPQRLIHGKEDYTVNNIVLDMKTGHYVRSVSSVLRTGPIGDEHSGKCLWCQAEFSGIVHPLKSNALCIQSESRYVELDKCSDAVIVNTSLICADVTEDFMARLKKEASLDVSATVDMLTNSTHSTSGVPILVSSQQPIPSPSQIALKSISGGFVKPTSVDKRLPYSTSLHTNSMVTASIAPSITPVLTIKNVVPTTADMVITTTDTPQINVENMGETSGPGMGLMEENGTNPNAPSRSSLEGPLYVAIVICAVFVVIIVVLVSTIVCLLRKKCGCLEIWIRSHLLWKKTTATSIVAQSTFMLNVCYKSKSLCMIDVSLI